MWRKEFTFFAQINFPFPITAGEYLRFVVWFYLCHPAAVIIRKRNVQAKLYETMRIVYLMIDGKLLGGCPKSPTSSHVLHVEPFVKLRINLIKAF